MPTAWSIDCKRGGVARHQRQSGSQVEASRQLRCGTASQYGAGIKAIHCPAATAGDNSAKPIERDPHRTAQRPDSGLDPLADPSCSRMRELAARAAQVIRVDALWLAVEPLDMRAGTEAVLSRVVQVFGAAQPHHAYLFANRGANRMKVLVHDGIGVWLAARRLNTGKFIWSAAAAARAQTLTREQLDALVLGLPWQRIGAAGVITQL